MKSKKLTPLCFIICTCHLLALAMCGRDMEGLEISDDAEMKLIEARAARMEAVEDEEEKPHKDASAATTEAAVPKYLQEEAKGPSDTPTNATRASQAAVKTVRELIRDESLAVVRCVKKLGRLWRLRYLLCQVMACGCVHCLACTVLIWGPVYFKVGARQNLEKLNDFSIPSLFCLLAGAAQSVGVTTVSSTMAITKGDDELHAILVEAALAVSVISAIPLYLAIYLSLTLVTTLIGFCTIGVVLSLNPPLPRSCHGLLHR